MYKELVAELRDYDGPVIYEDADGQHVERTAADLTRRSGAKAGSGGRNSIKMIN